MNPSFEQRLKRRIMRRVWLQYARSIATHRGFVLGIAFGASVQLLREFVFVARVFESFLATEIGQVPGFVYHLLTHADAPELMAAAVMLTSVWLMYRYIKLPTFRHQPVWPANRLSAG